MAGGINPAGALPIANPISNVVNTALSLDKNPFQSVLDKAVESLNKVSETDRRAEALIKKYVDGEVDMAEVMIEVEKANLSVQLALTIINTGVQTAKEVLQMPV
jgi:flagellar hook-basal body complex protein FliE